MCGVFTSLGSASVLVLVTSLLVIAAGGDYVTTQECENHDRSERVRQYPEDRDATELWLEYCNIDEINEDDIIGLPNITDMYLNNNDITHVDLAVFRHVPILEILRLYSNKLRELPAFPEHSCPRLTHLYLNHIQLTTIHDAGTFSACTHLQQLYLYNNQISYIHPDVFRSLTELVRLDLDYNKLSFIPDQMFINNKKLQDLRLYKNRLTYLPQDFASSLKSAGGGLDEFYFHYNPWRCACLLELLADVKRAGARYEDYYIFHKYDGTRPECVYSDAAPCCRHPPSGLLPLPLAAAGGRR